jgi:hypothetical protein
VNFTFANRACKSDSDMQVLLEDVHRLTYQSLRVSRSVDQWKTQTFAETYGFSSRTRQLGPSFCCPSTFLLLLEYYNIRRAEPKPESKFEDFMVKSNTLRSFIIFPSSECGHLRGTGTFVNYQICRDDSMPARPQVRFASFHLSTKLWSAWFITLRALTKASNALF